MNRRISQAKRISITTGLDSEADGEVVRLGEFNGVNNSKATNMTVATGGGNDRVDIDTYELTNALTVNLGSGSDKLRVFQREMEQGTDPADPRLQSLEQRRQSLISAFTGGDAGIEQSLTRLWKEQGDTLASQYGYDPKLMAFMGQVSAAAQTS